MGMCLKLCMAAGKRLTSSKIMDCFTIFLFISCFRGIFVICYSIWKEGGGGKNVLAVNFRLPKEYLI
jgi:hypothetical protein